ncbi:hypothetical protein DTL42_12620 [Bremerella cremea]|uniref:Uncharacterized protein n=1 Tax=Bremerella cremea TaxID=1031537 RepID=A0A368KR58_9BACT|nr:hypothetical protein [Bremerella cremea]RCS49368.1 hypothetical protein DTL42_12620 [Bremerella cremea]
MMATLRAIASIPLGVLAGMAAMLLLLTPCFLMYPLPAGIDLNNPADAEAFGRHLASLPTSAFVLVLIAHAGGAGCGAAFGRLIEGEPIWRESLVIGAIFTAMGLINAISLGLPLWFTLIDLPLYLPAAMLGGLALDAVLNRQTVPQMKKVNA